MVFTIHQSHTGVGTTHTSCPPYPTDGSTDLQTVHTTPATTFPPRTTDNNARFKITTRRSSNTPESEGTEY